MPCPNDFVLFRPKRQQTAWDRREKSITEKGEREGEREERERMPRRPFCIKVQREREDGNKQYICIPNLKKKKARSGRPEREEGKVFRGRREGSFLYLEFRVHETDFFKTCPPLLTHTELLEAYTFAALGVSYSLTTATSTCAATRGLVCTIRLAYGGDHPCGKGQKLSYCTRGINSLNTKIRAFPLTLCP